MHKFIAYGLQKLISGKSETSTEPILGTQDGFCLVSFLSFFCLVSLVSNHWDARKLTEIFYTKNYTK